MRTTTFIASALAAISLVATSCSNSSKLTFVVSNIPTEATTLELTAHIAKTDQTPDSIASDYKIEKIPLDAGKESAKLVNVTIPFDTRGLALTITISSSSEKCQLASWTGSVGSIDGKDYSVSAPLNKLEDDPIQQDLFTVTAIATNDVWVGGSNSTIGHWDGCYWKSSQIDNEGITGIVKLYYHKNSGLWALGANSTIAKYDNGKWTKLDHKNPWVLTSDYAQKILWLDMAFSEGSTEQLVVIGFNTLPATPPTTQQVCRALKITKSNGQYVFDATVESKLCNLPGATAARTIPSGTTHTASLYYPFKIASFPNGMVTTGQVYIDKKVGATTTAGIPYPAYARYQDQISLSNPVIKYVNPSASQVYTDPDDPKGSGGPIWGTSADNFWFGAPMLQHVTGPINSPTVTSAEFIYPPKGNLFMYNVWGTNDRDFWTIGLGTNANKTSEVLHIYDKTGAGGIISEQNIVPILYSTPVNILTVTNIAGASSSDVWMVGYGGYRVHYSNNRYVLYQK